MVEKVQATQSSRSIAKKIPKHPSTADMVLTAISTLKERHGSSLYAIKKFIATTYDVDAEKMSIFIKKYLRAAVESGVLVQPSGKGAAGSFKLPPKNRPRRATPPEPATPKMKSAGKPQKKSQRKSIRKPATKISQTKIEAEKKVKSPSKGKKGAKISAKSKRPKPKKIVSPKAKVSEMKK